MKCADGFFKIFSLPVRRILQKADLNFGELQEIRMRINSPLMIRQRGKEYKLTEEGKLLRCNGNEQYEKENIHYVDRCELMETMEYIAGYSLYAYEDEIRQGFLSVQGGHRVGVTGKVILDGNRIRGMKYISCINVRLAHEIQGCAQSVMPYIQTREQIMHTLIVSPPRCGKTTLLRDIIRMVSDGNRLAGGMTVGVVDERSELAGCCDGIAVNDLGMRTDILDGCLKAAGMLMLLRSMAPDVVAVDELGDREDTTALEQVLKCGCSVLATVHGGSYEELSRKRFLQPLLQAGAFQRYLVLKHCDGTFFVEQVRDGDGQLLASGLACCA